MHLLQNMNPPNHKINTKYFSRASVCDRRFPGKARELWTSLTDNRDLYINSQSIVSCEFYGSDTNFYLLTGKCDEFRFYTDERIQEFEDQFLFFPYTQSEIITVTFDKIKVLEKKNSELEKQNLALLSHVETILTCLRMRGITDDNMDFTLPN